VLLLLVCCCHVNAYRHKESAKFLQKNLSFGSKKSRFLFVAVVTTSRLLSTDFRRGRLLGEQHRLDVRQDSSLCDGHSGEQLVQLLVVADGQLEVTGDDPRLLVVSRGVAGQLEHLGCQVLHDGRQVDGRSGSDTLGVVALTEQTMDASDGELEPCTARPGLRLSLDLASFTASRHDSA
jgi:hypothetical protein